MKHSKVAIIGAGPAGIACAVQLKRFGIPFVLFEKNQTGGLLRNANLVENYLGFEKGISGKKLADKFRKNLEILNISPVFAEVKKVTYKGFFLVETAEDLFTCEVLVIASGTKPKKLQLNVENSIKDRIFYELADLSENDCSGKKFVIIGAGDAAFDYAINLADNYNAEEIIILNRGEKTKCLPLLEKRAAEREKIKYFKNVNFDEFFKKFGVDYIIAAIGREPYLDFLDENLKNDIPELQNKNLLHIIGDAANGYLRQTSIATGDGLKTAMKVFNTFS